MSRYVVWFSCGIASAVTAKLITAKYANTEVVYCNTFKEEHPDNKRFLKDVEKWIKHPIKIISSETFKSVSDVFMKTRYMSGPLGARCTVEMKKVPRFKFQKWDDIHCFGYTVEEQKRINRFEENNPDMKLKWVLLEERLTKDACLEMVARAGIEIPTMYKLGFRNNNCIGCVKATSPRYWNMVRKFFPKVFTLRAKQSREIGCRLTRYKGKRLFLDQLPASAMAGKLGNVSCGPECGIQK